MTSDQRIRLATLFIWITPAFWAVNYLVARKAPGVIDPYSLALGRWALAGAILGYWARVEIRQHISQIREVWFEWVILGTLGMLICGAWVYHGARTTQAVNIALIYSISPVMISITAVIWLGERMSILQRVGVALSLLGVFHVVLRGQWMHLGDVQWVVGDFWVLASSTAWAIFVILQKKWASPLGATARLACICAGGCLMLIPCVIWEITQPNTPPMSVDALVLVVAAALFPGIGAYGSYSWAQKVLGVSRVSVALYLSPLWSAVVAWLFLGEHLEIHHLVGAAMILPGVALVTRQWKKIS